MLGGPRSAIGRRRTSRPRTALAVTVAIVAVVLVTASTIAAPAPLVSLVIGSLIAGIGLLLLIGRRRDV